MYGLGVFSCQKWYTFVADLFFLFTEVLCILFFKIIILMISLSWILPDIYLYIYFYLTGFLRRILKNTCMHGRRYTWEIPLFGDKPSNLRFHLTILITWYCLRIDFSVSYFWHGVVWLLICKHPYVCIFISGRSHSWTITTVINDGVSLYKS